jgi:hypothetical protein
MDGAIFLALDDPTSPTMHMISYPFLYSPSPMSPYLIIFIFPMNE